MNTPTIIDRALHEAMRHQPTFSVMDVLFALNKQHPYPMVDLRQVHQALDRLARDGKFTKTAAGRYEWSQ